MSSLKQFQEALQQERANDPRPIIGARVSSAFLKEISTEVSALLVAPSYEQDRLINQINGITLFIGMSNEILFDH